MTCTSDHTALAIDETCAECGHAAQREESSENSPVAPTSALSSFFAIKKNQQITAAAAVVFVVLAGFVGFKVLKKSPAVPYLTSACETMTPIDFGKQNKAANEALLSSIKTDIDVASTMDAAAAAPFQVIVSDLETIMDATNANNLQFALMLTLNSYSNLKSIQRELDRIIKLGEELEVDIDSVCSSYVAQ
jgi:hypothetical protein